MAGKSIEESRAAQKQDKEAKCDKEAKQSKPGNNTSNLSVIKDANGKAYIVNLNTNSILNKSSDTKTNDTTNFVGLSSDESHLAPSISDEEAIEYEGWLAKDHDDTTIDWHACNNKLGTNTIKRIAQEEDVKIGRAHV